MTIEIKSTVENPEDTEINLPNTDPVTERAPFIPHAQGKSPGRLWVIALSPLGKGIPIK
jgi:hypothetical protein